ncbi:hypothetical protein [Anabaena sp. PCC 7108]|uniref:hypothetical protein n=1 Tax=Anabaena sp. PCC 7108 TaxID=163908 RepID=UPI0003454BEA|nr:hypothetical protein [Anabaena sp. PCC 7108]
MTVQELIERLSKLPPEAEVHFEGYDDDEAEELLDELILDVLPPDSQTHIKEGSFSLLPLKDKDCQP